ncbi:hypothetical protein JTB14_017701 [Gonioctena quinquepunctata]|nr:hypothetical protein JTB14_017701 [Gonioctena quinquepunctata]
MDIDHVDIATAFLHGNLNEKIYPRGFMDDNDNRVCLLRKSIYGLKQASRQWNCKVHELLTTAGYVQSKCEACVYIKKTDGTLVVIALYVDDFFIFNNSQKEKNILIERLQAEFDVKYLGAVTSCLGMKVSRNRSHGQLILSQSEYTKNLLKSFGMSESKPISTPMCLNTKLVKPNEIDVLSDDKYQFRRLIGGLMYLSVCTRPDIAFACSQLSQFNYCYDQSHWTAAKRVLRYLSGTKDYGLIFEKADNQKIEAFTDADWADDPLDRRFCGGDGHQND